MRAPLRQWKKLPFLMELSYRSLLFTQKLIIMFGCFLRKFFCRNLYCSFGGSDGGGDGGGSGGDTCEIVYQFEGVKVTAMPKTRDAIAYEQVNKDGMKI